MKFWDSSALVPIVVEQRFSARLRQLRRADPEVVVWALTQTELVSAVFRLRREGELSGAGVAVALRRVEQMAASWSEIDGVVPVRERAERLLAVHVLSAGDALQLAAALLASGERPRGRNFVCADARLAAAARAEGFNVVEPSE